VPIVIHPNVHFIMDSVLSVRALFGCLRYVDQYSQVGICGPILEHVLRDSVGYIFKLALPRLIIWIQQVVLITARKLEQRQRGLVILIKFFRVRLKKLADTHLAGQAAVVRVEEEFGDTGEKKLPDTSGEAALLRNQLRDLVCERFAGSLDLLILAILVLHQGHSLRQLIEGFGCGGCSRHFFWQVNTSDGICDSRFLACVKLVNVSVVIPSAQAKSP